MSGDRFRISLFLWSPCPMIFWRTTTADKNYALLEALSLIYWVWRQGTILGAVWTRPNVTDANQINGERHTLSSFFSLRRDYESPVRASNHGT